VAPFRPLSVEWVCARIARAVIGLVMREFSATEGSKGGSWRDVASRA